MQNKSKENKFSSFQDMQVNKPQKQPESKGKRKVLRSQQVDQSLIREKETELSDQPLKNEKLDSEIEEMAKKIRRDNDKKLMQFKNNFATQNQHLNEKEFIAEVTPEDWTSVRGQFGWTEVANTTIPYLIRSGEKYVSLRMAENKVLIKYRQVFTDEIRSCFRVKVVHVTSAEAQLLNEINFRHCDNFYGRLEFTMSDGIISLKDFTEMYQFLNFCHLRLIEKIAVPQNRCGFIKVARQNCVPYVWHKNKQYVALFYFEGECKYLEEQSTALSGWELAYLKLYCKIQGIRKALFDEESVSVVDLELVKSLFPPDTFFEETWPVEYKIDTLVQKPVPKPKLVLSQPQHKYKQATAVNAKITSSPQNGAKKKVVGSENNAPIPQREHLFIAPKPYCISVPTTETKQTNLRISQPCSDATNKSTQINNDVQVFCASISYPKQHAPVPSSNKTSITNNSLPKTAADQNTDYQREFIRSAIGSQNFPSSLVCYKPAPVARSLVPGMYKRGSNVLQIPDVSYSNAYYVVRAQVEDKVFQYCINMEPFITTILLVSLEESSLFFQLPVDLVVNATNVMNIDIFLPNKMQKKEFEKFKVDPTGGLLKLREFIDNLPQLRYILNKIKTFD